MRLTASEFNARFCFSIGKIQAFLLVLVGIMWGNTLTAQTYCTSQATFTGDSNCEEVIFNTINNNTASLCADDSDFTGQSTTVMIGSSYSLSVRPGTCGSDFDKSGKVYIDWNQNGVFTDAGEEVFSFGPTNPTATFSTTVTVPGIAAIGSTRMR